MEITEKTLREKRYFLFTNGEDVEADIYYSEECNCYSVSFNYKIKVFRNFKRALKRINRLVEKYQLELI